MTSQDGNWGGEVVKVEALRGKGLGHAHHPRPFSQPPHFCPKVGHPLLILILYKGGITNISSILLLLEETTYHFSNACTPLLINFFIYFSKFKVSGRPILMMLLVQL